MIQPPPLCLWALDQQWNQSPVLVHQVVSGLRQLRQVGQQRTQVVQFSVLIVTFSTEDLNKLRHTDVLLQHLKQKQFVSHYPWGGDQCDGKVRRVMNSVLKWSAQTGRTLNKVLQVFSCRVRFDRMVQIWSENGYSGSRRFLNNTGRTLTSFTKTWGTHNNQQTTVTCLF